MVLQRSVESPLSYSSKCNKEDVVWDWIPEKQAWNTCSQSPKENLYLPSNCSSFGSNVQCKRIKIHGNSIIVLQETSACGSGDRVRAPVVDARRGKNDLGHLDDSQRTRTSSVWNSPDSEAEVSLDDDSQSRAICTALITSHGFPLRDGSRSNSVPVSTTSRNNNNNNYQSCEACDDLENIAEMIICDGCEEAFHVSCSGASQEALDADEWYCRSCLKVNRKDAIGTPDVRSQSMRGWSLGSRYRLGPIACMLKYPDSHTSKVRVGDSFQAIVPEWPYQTTDCRDSDSFGEPIMMDPLETLGLHGCAKDSLLLPNSVSNWLQCQDVVDDDEVICGKWRRAPFSEVQTNDWDCSCALPWDPFHADCIVPQEMETKIVVAQLKYVHQLKSRLTAKKRN
ncbi:hypothetical protein LINGRAHAP2_LOCUS7824 [Linum grandiflorum]